jgi:hypothetical protein
VPVTRATVAALPAGGTDDASASALLAAGFLAALTGVPVDPAATLTGMLAPDGTIGPVAGLPERALGAIAHGKTRIGYPAGLRRARSQVTGKDVDIVELARQHRVEAVEIADIHDAYRLLTRRQLPAPVPVPEADMALDPPTRRALEARYRDWQSRVAGEWAALLQLEQAGRIPPTIEQMMRLARARSDQAEALRRRDELVAAYGRMAAAWIYARSANDTHTVLARVTAGDIDGALATLATLDTAEERTRATLEQLGATQPTTLGGQLAMIEALQVALRGWATHASAAAAIAETTQHVQDLRGKARSVLGAPATADAVATAVGPAVLRVLRTVAEATLAAQLLALEPELGPEYRCAPAELSRLAAGFQAAAAAELRYLDRLLVEPLARRTGLAPDVARRRLAAVEPDFLLATALAGVPDEGLLRDLVAAWGADSSGASALRLASQLAAHHEAALVVAKYGSLEVRADDAGKITSVGQAPAFRRQLASAGLRARASARAARIATGTIPVQARLAYQLARVDAAGDLDDQIYALSSLWTSTAFSQTAVMLARNASAVDPGP